MNIFVTKLSPNVSQEDLQDLFANYGNVSSAKVIIDRETGNSKGYGFVEMDDDSEGQAAIEAINDSEIDGRRVVVKEARPREDMGGGGGGRRPSSNNDRGGFNRDRGGYGGGGGGGDRRGGGGGGDRRGGSDRGFNRGGYD